MCSLSASVFQPVSDAVTTTKFGSCLTALFSAVNQKLDLVFPQNKIPVDNWNTTFTIQLTKQSPITASNLEMHHRQQQQQQPFNGRLSGTTRVGRYQKKHSPTHTHPGQCTSFITFLHLQRSTASSLFSLRA